MNLLRAPWFVTPALFVFENFFLKHTNAVTGTNTGALFPAKHKTKCREIIGVLMLRARIKRFLPKWCRWRCWRGGPCKYVRKRTRLNKLFKDVVKIEPWTRRHCSSPLKCRFADDFDGSREKKRKKITITRKIVSNSLGERFQVDYGRNPTNLLRRCVFILR